MSHPTLHFSFLEIKSLGATSFVVMSFVIQTFAWIESFYTCINGSLLKIEYYRNCRKFQKMESNAMVKENYVSEIFPTGGQYSKKERLQSTH